MTFYSAPTPKPFSLSNVRVCVSNPRMSTLLVDSNSSGFGPNPCDAVESIPEYLSNSICPTPVPWDLTEVGTPPTQRKLRPILWRDLQFYCSPTILELPNVEGNLLQCISSVEIFNWTSSHQTCKCPSPRCENLEEFFSGQLQRRQLQPDSEPCLACPETSCETCYSDITEIDWTYSINGGSTFDQFPEDPLTGNNISIPRCLDHRVNHLDPGHFLHRFECRS